MNREIIDLLYLVAAVLFIFALRGLCSPQTARRGNALGALGMLVAIVATLLMGQAITYTWILLGLVIGGAIGGTMAYTVRMTAMPQMVASFNGSGALAAGLVVLAEFFRGGASLATEGLFPITAAVSTLISWLTFTGSLVAVAKLQEYIQPRPILFPWQKVLNAVLLGVNVVLIVLLGLFPEHRWLLIVEIVLASVLGVLVVIPIGGADMPVVISLLNSFTGLATAGTGFLLGNAGLIISGALVGASGIILTRLMSKAMNRSLANVLFGAFGRVARKTPPGGTLQARPVRAYTPEDAALTLSNASRVIIVPGYGMAVAQAQHAVKDLADQLQKLGVTVKYAIHPVAGRMPGHMNVLLAEADVPYDQLHEMDEINPEFEQSDAALVIGANDVVNPAARSAPASPIYGMPILNADKARTTIVLKRSLKPGFAGIDNELFYRDNTMMVFGDAKDTLNKILAAVKNYTST